MKVNWLGLVHEMWTDREQFPHATTQRGQLPVLNIGFSAVNPGLGFGIVIICVLESGDKPAGISWFYNFEKCICCVCEDMT